MSEAGRADAGVPNADRSIAAAPPPVVTVRSAIAPLHAEPRVSSPQVSQRLAGHALHVRSTDGDWLYACGDDGYAGWVHRGYLDAGDARAAPASAERLLSLGCVARDANTGAVRALPLGAWLRREERVESGVAVDDVHRQRTFPRDAAAVAATAVQRFSGTSYQWGGVTPWGADCSGLVQTTFWLHGVQLPRDAWQQAEVGVDAGNDLIALAPADLLFFSERADRRVTHVGMAVGAGRMVHLALGRGGYAVDRLDATDDAYVAALVGRFVAARRVV